VGPCHHRRGKSTFRSAARAPEIALLRVASSVRLSAETAQRIFYTLLAMALVRRPCSSSSPSSSPLAAGVAGTLALLNPFVLQHLPTRCHFGPSR
jgi:hypothetical protein